MCVANLKKRYQAWIKSQKIHPFWLELKDREVKRKYDVWVRNHIYKIGKVLTAALFGISILTALSNR